MFVNFPPAYFVRAPGVYFDEFGTGPCAASSTATIVSYTVPARHVGVLLAVAFEGGQLTNWYWGSWNLEIQGLVDRNLNDVRGMVSRIMEPLPVYRVLQPNTTIRAIVRNLNTTTSFQYGARLMGYVQEESVPLAERVDLRREG